MFAGIGIVVTLLTLIVNSVFQAMREKRRDDLSLKNRELDIQERREASTAAAVQVGNVGDHLAAKIDENTQVSVKAFDVANNVNDKIATVAVQANEHAVTSMNDVMAELAAIKRMLQAKK
jgi:uncharacterized membrane protein YhiD involved in acid resistance